MTVRSLLFDLDGTLADSAPDLCAAGNHLRAMRGLPVLPFAALRGVCGKGARGLIWGCLRIPSEAASFRLLQQEFLHWYEEHMCEHLRLMSGVDQLLDELQRRDIPWGIVTNKYESLARATCQALCLQSKMRCLVGGDTVGKRKPAPEPLLHALQTAHFDPAATVYVGDDARDMAAARNAGLAGWAACWGYLASGESAACWGAQRVLSTPKDILRVLDC